MKIIDIINHTDKPRFSFELLPPPKGKDINLIYQAIDPLIGYNPAFISVTYHREEVAFKQHKNGLLEKKTIHKRPGTVAISAAIKHKYNLVVLPHLICGGFSKEETENALIDLHFLGIRDVLALRGDPIKFEERFIPEPDGHAHALDLVKQISKLNKGTYLDDELLNTTATNFSIGVAGYPEKHAEAPNMSFDLDILKKKVDAGAEYIVTQMFFETSKFIEFVNSCRAIGINVPIIPGIKPISSMKHLHMLPQTFNIDIPEELVKNILKCSNNEEVKQVGIDWAIKQSKELLEFGCPIIHYYTMGKADNIVRIIQSVF